MRIAINGNRHQEGHLENIDRLVSALLRRGDTVAISILKTASEGASP